MNVSTPESSQHHETPTIQLPTFAEILRYFGDQAGQLLVGIGNSLKMIPASFPLMVADLFEAYGATEAAKDFRLNTIPSETHFFQGGVEVDRSGRPLGQ